MAKRARESKSNPPATHIAVKAESLSAGAPQLGAPTVGVSQHVKALSLHIGPKKRASEEELRALMREFYSTYADNTGRA